MTTDRVSGGLPQNPFRSSLPGIRPERYSRPEDRAIAKALTSPPSIRDSAVLLSESRLLRGIDRENSLFLATRAPQNTAAYGVVRAELSQNYDSRKRFVLSIERSAEIVRAYEREPEVPEFVKELLRAEALRRGGDAAKEPSVGGEGDGVAVGAGGAGAVTPPIPVPALSRIPS